MSKDHLGCDAVINLLLFFGEPNPWITAERVAKLEALGFEWVVLKRKR